MSADASNAPVIISDYDQQWPKVFDELKVMLQAQLGNLALAIEHVGSTSVPGLPAKPIIDLDVVIGSTERLPQVVQTLSKLGYIHQGDLGISGREAFAREGQDVPRDGTGRVWIDHHLYVCAQGSRELRRHLAFRDHLRTNPETAAAYGELKRALAQRFRNDREGYCEAKTEFVEGVLAKVMPVMRDATRIDVALLTRLIRHSFRDVAERFGLTPDNCPSHPSFTTEAKVAEGFDKGGRFFILEAPSGPSGCVGLMPDKPELWSLVRLAVLPSHRRCGFGAMLVDHALAVARKAGVPRVELGIIAAHAELLGFYERLGFRVTKMFKPAHLPFEVAIMVRELVR